MVWLTLVNLSLLIAHAHFRVIRPLREIFLMTEFILNNSHNNFSSTHQRYLSKRRALNFHKLVKKIHFLE